MMALPETFRIQVPATSANLGPGFDLLGLALNQYAYFDISFRGGGEYTVLLEDGSSMDIPLEKNLVRCAYLRCLEEKKVPFAIPALEVKFRTDISVGRGFGSSACALVAGFAAANHLLAFHKIGTIALEEELQILTEMESHPDNVCPARLGGWVFSYYNESGRIVPVRKKLPDSLGLCVIVPEFQISTKKSRGKLPQSLSYPDILSNLQGVMLWMEYLHTENPEMLRRAVQLDRMHEPYRGKDIPGYTTLKNDLDKIGCYGATISGSGPGIIVYYPVEREERIVADIKNTLITNSGSGDLKICRPDNTGLRQLSAVK